MEIASKIAVLVAGLVLLGYSIRSAATGEIAYKAFVTKREDKPFSFWAQAVSYALIGIGLIAVEVLALKK